MPGVIARLAPFAALLLALAALAAGLVGGFRTGKPAGQTPKQVIYCILVGELEFPCVRTPLAS